MTTSLNRRNRSAFTLIEVMIAVAIIATTLLYLVLARNRAVTQAADTNSYLLAVQLADMKLSDILAHSEKLQGDSSGDFSDEAEFLRNTDLSEYGWRCAIEEEQPADTEDAGDGPPEFTAVRVKVEVFYPGVHDERETYALETIALRPNQ